MAEPDILILHGIEELGAHAGDWDDLWQRSDVYSPNVRAAMVQLWVEQFAPRRRFRVVAVADAGRFVAALPVVYRYVAGVPCIGSLPRNEWAGNGDLLLDPHCDVDRVLDRLVTGLRRLRWALFHFGHVRHTAPRWQAFIAALERQQIPFRERKACQVGIVELAPSWDLYIESRRRGHAGAIKKYMRAERRAEAAGGAELQVIREFRPGQLASLMRTLFDIEDRSWKGDAGSSVLKNPQAMRYYLGEARQLAEWGNLELSFLSIGGRPAAFPYACNSRHYSIQKKIGYDTAYGSCSPGRVLTARHLRFLHEEGLCSRSDFVGELTEADAVWATTTYSMAPLVLAAPTIGTAAFRYYDRWLPRVRDVWQRLRSATSEPKPQPAGVARDGNASVKRRELSVMDATD
jgi:hypothetical protein